jgi:hypothetical protein
MTYTGRCACGNVTLTITGETIGTRQCWCRQCQHIAGGGPTHNAIFQATDVDLQGAVAASAWIAASGNTLTHRFCSSCGTPVYAESSARPHLMTIRMGVLDPRHGLKPQVAIWTDDAPDWAVIDPAMESWPRQPPPPPSLK